MQLSEIKPGQSLHALRLCDNLYVPFGKSPIRRIEDIDTGEFCRIRTDGETVWAVLSGDWSPEGKKKKAETLQLSFL